MPLVNLRYYQRARFFWDERAGNLEEMVLLPVQSRIEMGQDLSQVVDTIARDATYPALFARAFGDRQITEQRIGKALAQFVRSIVSYQSRYDKGRARAQSAQDDFDNFTLQENRGKALFMRNCGTCHMKDGQRALLRPDPGQHGIARQGCESRRRRWRRDAAGAGPRLVQVALAPQRRGHRAVRSRRTLRDARRADRSLQRQCDSRSERRLHDSSGAVELHRIREGGARLPS